MNVLRAASVVAIAVFMCVSVLCSERLLARPVLRGQEASVTSNPQNPRATGSSQGFVWLDDQKDPSVWHGIEEAFAIELKPDSAQEVMPYEPMMFKTIARVASIGDAALVLIDKRLSEHAKSSSVSAFNYDLKTGRKTPIPIKWTTWDWKYYGIAHFEPSTPDILFTFNSCTDCDATSILGSYSYQPNAKLWKVRNWVGDEQGIFIGGKHETSRGQILDECVFAVKDFENIGHDQVIDFCRRKEQGSDQPFRVYSLTMRADIFQVVNGRPIARSAKNTTERKNLLTEICKTEGAAASELCSETPK